MSENSEKNQTSQEEKSTEEQWEIQEGQYYNEGNLDGLDNLEKEVEKVIEQEQGTDPATTTSMMEHEEVPAVERQNSTTKEKPW